MLAFRSIAEVLGTGISVVTVSALGRDATGNQQPTENECY